MFIFIDLARAASNLETILRLVAPSRLNVKQEGGRHIDLFPDIFTSEITTEQACAGGGKYKLDRWGGGNSHRH